MGEQQREPRPGSSTKITIGDRGEENWYALVKSRTQRSTELGGMAISLTILASQWGQWRHFALALTWMMAVWVWSASYERYLAKRLVPGAERIREVINCFICVPMFHLIGWPLPSWFWLLFMAAELDSAGVHKSFFLLGALCATETVWAAFDGVSLLQGVSFSLLALVVWNTSNARSLFMRSLMNKTIAQRDEVASINRQLEAETAARTRAEIELRSAQKLEALGRLAAGVAHEINTPMQFVSDSLEFVLSGTADLLALAEKCASPQAAKDADLDYLSAEMPTSLQQARDGVKRVAAIIRSMKELAHPGGTEHAPVDINHAIETTLTVASHEYKMVADVSTDLAADLPMLHGNGGELNQVFLNLIVNAAQSIEDVHKRTKRRGRILISTRAVGGAIEVAISDTGAGIPSPIRSQIFEPFFTTKAVGRGTGQGLAIARAVIERHGGVMSFVSEVDMGTTFRIRLPLTERQDAAVRAAA